jgi:hypothetical protein
MNTLYWKFIGWMSTLSMEEVFIFTGASILVFCFAFSISYSLYIFRKQDGEDTTNKNQGKTKNNLI